MRFRNIWYRPLPPRAVEGGTDGWLTTDATMAKRKQIAADIRQDAEQLANPANPVPQMLRLLESLAYEQDDATVQKVEQMAGAVHKTVKQLPADQIGAKKDEVKQVAGALDYLAKHNILPPTFRPEKPKPTASSKSTSGTKSDPARLEGGFGALLACLKSENPNPEPFPQTARPSLSRTFHTKKKFFSRRRLQAVGESCGV